MYEQKGKDGRVIWPSAGNPPNHKYSPFNEACLEILNIRKNNGLERASIGEVMEDVDAAQCVRLGSDPNWCDSKKKPFNFSPVQMFRAAASHVQVVADRSQQALDGLNILKEWFGNGAIPVARELSQGRADVCLTCPFNKPGFKPVEALAEKIKQQAEKKNELKLSVVGETDLHTCDCCWCHLPLKVHVPFSTILDQTPAPMIEKFKVSPTLLDCE